MPQFKPGDVVRLKSGGPAMTVQEIATNGLVLCRWFAEGKDVKADHFLPDMLEPAKPPHRGVTTG